MRKFLLLCLAILIALGLVFTLFIGGGHYRAASESMAPTLNAGDRIYVSKLSYGVGRGGSADSNIPKRGDVVIFRHPTRNLIMIKRVVGLPGDEVQYRQGRLYINGAMIERKTVDKIKYRERSPRSSQRDSRIVEVTVYEEQFLGEETPHRIFERSDYDMFDQTELFRVPEGTMFLMGDNRDNSNDSRSISGFGFVPFKNLVGKAKWIIASGTQCKKEEGLHCPEPRRFSPL